MESCQGYGKVHTAGLIALSHAVSTAMHSASHGRFSDKQRHCPKYPWKSCVETRTHRVDRYWNVVVGVGYHRHIPAAVAHGAFHTFVCSMFFARVQKHA